MSLSPPEKRSKSLDSSVSSIRTVNVDSLVGSSVTAISINPADPTPITGTSAEEREREREREVSREREREREGEGTVWFPESPPLPSPPDSPYSSASVSSFPSVGSSFFFSSAAASPPHPPTDPGTDIEGLIIPSLTLPDPLRRPTAYGKTLGEVRLIVLGKDTKRVAEGLLDCEGNDDIVEVRWAHEGESVVRASTDWSEVVDVENLNLNLNHGRERYEPLRNVEVRCVEVDDDEEDDIIQDHITSIKSYVQQPFQALSDVLHPEGQPSAVLANLLSSPCTPLNTALVLLVDNPPTIQQTTLLTSLASYLPIIPLPSSPSHRLPRLPHAAGFRPVSTHHLMQGLFRTPETLALLRSEAADKFMKWREVERAVSRIQSGSSSSSRSSSWQGSGGTDKGKERDGGWDKQKWEQEYLHSLSYDVAKTLRTRSSTITPCAPHPPSFPSASSSQYSHPCPSYSDPLHLPSLFLFSLSLLGPIKKSIGQMVGETVALLGDGRVKVVLVGGFLVGISVGRFVR